MSKLERPEWGISTGLACPDMTLDKAVRSLLPHKPQIIELCPGTLVPNSEQTAELLKMRDNEGLSYTLHMHTQFRPKDQHKGGLQWFQSGNEAALSTARKINPRWLVHHPPITPYGTLLEAERREFMNELERYRFPVLLESGVYRRDRLTNQVLESECCRDPRDFAPFLSHSVQGIVADVPKMSRFRELQAQGRRSKHDIQAYIEKCKEFGIPIREVHLTGVEFWDEDLEFDKFTLETLRTQRIFPDALIIESTPGRLPSVVELVRSMV